MMDDVADMVRLSQLMTCNRLVYTADSKSDYVVTTWLYMYSVSSLLTKLQ